MKIRKFLFTLLVSVFTLCMSMFVFTACGSGSEEETGHTHSWGEWQVETPASCSKDGKEVRYCSTDASHKQERIIAKTGEHHGYIFCFGCGELAINAEDAKFYNNTIDSLAEVRNVACVVKGVDISFHEVYMQDDYYEEDFTYEENIAFDCDFAEVVVGVNEEGELFAYGTGEVKVSGEFMPVEPIKLNAYFQGKVGYFKLDTNGWEDYFIKVDATEFMELLAQRLAPESIELEIDYLMQMLSSYVPEDFHGIIGDLATWLKTSAKEDVGAFIEQNGPFAKNMIAAMIAPAVKKVETENGYKISFDYDIIRNFNNDLATKTVEDWLAGIFGANPLVKIRAGIDKVLALTFGEIKAKVENELGMTISEFIDMVWQVLELPEEIEGMTKDDLAGLIDQQFSGNISIGNFIQNILVQQGQNIDFVEELDGLFAKLDLILDYTIYELFLVPVTSPEVDGPNVEILPEGYAADSATPPSFPDIGDDVFIQQMLQMFKDTINGFVDLMEEVYGVDLYTDSEGKIDRIAYDVDFEFDLDRFNELFGNFGVGGDNIVELELKADCDIALIPNYQTELTAKYLEFKAQAEEFFNKIDLSPDVILSQLKEHFGEENVIYQDGVYHISAGEYGLDFEVPAEVIMVGDICGDVAYLILPLSVGYNLKTKTLIFADELGHDFEIDSSKSTIVGGFVKTCFKCSNCAKEVYENRPIGWDTSVD